MELSLVSLAELDDDVDLVEIGGKARNLGRLARAGVTVPAGFVIPAAIVDRLVVGDAEARDAVTRRAAALDSQLAVRSSANIEDGSDGAAPGLFDSVVDVSPGDVLAAVDAVAASARSPAVAAYQKRRGGGPVRIAVVVQRYLRPRATGVLYTRPPDDPRGEHAVVEVGGRHPALARLDRETGAVLEAHDDLPLSADRLAELWRAARAAEDAIGADGGADVEWVDDGETLWLVQARPIVHRPAVASDVAELLAFSTADPSLVWHLDATHNPDPMSPSQIGLVRRVAPIAPYPMRIVGGYLYTASRRDRPGDASPAPTADELRRLADDRIGPAIEAALAGVEGPEPAALADALAAYDAVYRLYAVELSPVVSRALRSLGDRVPHQSHPFGRALADAAAGRLSEDALHAMLSPASPAWDVAVPTYGERPELIERALERYREAPSPAAADDDPVNQILDLAERDDLWFFRAQAAVRHSLLALAARWQLAEPRDIFYLDLGEVVAAAKADDPGALGDVAARADQARRGRDRERRRAMPLAFRAGRATCAPPPPSTGIWRGRGTGGIAEGRVVRVAELGAEPRDIPGDRVLVTRSVTPATLLSALDVSAIVCEYGELLGHGAAMARELGVPCVIGCSGAWRALSDGDYVLVDADSGVVVRLAEGARAPE